MSAEPGTVLEVRGGSHGVAARFAAWRGLADSFDLTGDELRAQAAATAAVMTDADLLASAPLSPATFVESEAAVLAAATGPSGVLPQAVGWEVDAYLLRETVAAFEESDEVVRLAFDTLDYALGQLIGTTLLGLGAAGVVVGGATTLVLRTPQGRVLAGSLPPEALAGLRDRAQQRGDETLAALAAEHPEALERLFGSGGGLLDALLGGGPLAPLPGPALHPTTEAAARSLAALFGREGDPTVRRLDAPAASEAAPATVADVMDRLDATHRLSAAGHHGSIEITTVRGDDGVDRHLVTIPGTDAMDTLPGGRGEQSRDMAANLRLMGGADSTHARGVLEAMRRAGIGPDEPVLLAGHSQGGLTALHLAAHQRDFTISHVITAGSPAAHVPDLPAGVRVLSLENRGDVVPLVDGAPNRDTTAHLTVRFDAGGATLVDRHDLDRYGAGARALESAEHPSVAARLAELADEGFLGERRQERSQIFQITR